MRTLQPTSLMEAATAMLGCAAPLALIFLAVFSQQVQALDIEYCTGINTATRPGNYSMYQSNGLCLGFCEQSYAFAIVQHTLCWCSNYAPATTVPDDKCDTKCPGYPKEFCGGDDLYGYIRLHKPPAGTKSESGTDVTTSPTKNPTTTEIPKESPEPTWTPTPITTVQTITGEVRVITITPTAPPPSHEESSGLSVGASTGLGIGLAAFASIIGILIFFFLRRRRRRREAEAATTSPTPVNGYTPQRTMSENSRYMLGTDGHRVVEGWDGDPSDTPASAGSRRSRLMPVDPRLDPFAPVYQRERRMSGDSVGSIQDNHDYSRRVHQTGPILRATNPDT